jgi:hypothetical protein
MKRELTNREKAFIPYCKSLKKEYADKGMEDLFDAKIAWEDFNDICDEYELDELEYEDGAIYETYVS